MSSNYQALKEWRKRVKLRLVDAFGGSCCICSYSEPVALDLHHLDPKEKDFSISSWRKAGGWTKLVEEARKCVLVCSNCHRCIHAGIIDVPADAPRFNEDFSDFKEKVSVVLIRCSVCFSEMPNVRNYCSTKCSNKAKSKFDWSSQEVISILEREGTFRRAAKVVGVSDVAFAKQYKKHHPNHKRK